MSIEVSLGEGNTPLIESVHVGPSMGLDRLFFKLENCNPSGSYKDRFIASEMARLLRTGARACVATSSGNTGSALAAYCARYGITCLIVVNEDAPAGKLQQMQAHAARVFRVKGFATSPEITKRVFQTLKELSAWQGLPLVVSAFRYCPEGMAGVESIAEELLQQSPFRIDHVFVPVGGGGLFSAVCRGFDRHPDRAARVHAVQPSGCSTVAAAFERGDSEIRPVQSTTRISGLAVPLDIDASLALEHLRRRGGCGFAVEDEEVFEMQQSLLSKEGIYCEPAGAAALAGLRKALKLGVVSGGDTVICLVTGHGFKDPDSVRRAAEKHLPALIGPDELEDKLVEAALCA
jgi:threonine synthase